jgi:excisionase family DNA binding protein
MRLISVNETAARLGVSPSTVRKLISAGLLPQVRVTRRTVRVPESVVADWVNSWTKRALADSWTW